MTDQVSAAERSRIGMEPRSGGTVRGRRIGAIGLVAATTVATLIAGAVSAGAAPVAVGAGGTGVSAAPKRLGTTPHAPQGAVRTGTPASSTRVELRVGLEPRDVNALQQFITATSTQGNAQYHHFLGKGQFASTFGPTQATIAQVTAALKAQGLHPGKVSADGMTIPVSTTLDAAARAFGTGFSSYRLADGSSGFLNTAAPQVPGNIAGAVSGIVGLSSLVRHGSYHQARTGKAAAAPSKAATGRAAAAPAVSTTGPEICSAATSALNSTYPGVADGNGFYSAGSLARIYGMQHTGTSGSGTTIGVFEMENFSDSDLAAYQSCYGTHVSVQRVTVDGGPTEAPSKSQNRGVESLIDLEDIAALAPGANVIDYQGPDLDLSTTLDQQFWDTYQKMVTDDQASILSVSYGACEVDVKAYDPALLAFEAQSSMQAAAQGQTILAASGDDGATTCVHDTGSPNVNAASVSEPAGQPYVTAVGGTTLLGGITAPTRTTWNHDKGATGGGISVTPLANMFNYQLGFAGKGFTTTACHAPSGTTCRQVPDVAADADPNTGYPVYIGGGWDIYGGTSAATPTWAALLAIAGTTPACQGKTGFGLVNPALYAAAKANYAADFTDITSGTNGIAAGLTSYSAGTGYDLTTGLGEPKAAALSAALCGSLPLAGSGTYNPVAPTLLLDTRKASKTPLPASGRASVQITGATLSDGTKIPTTGVTSVVLNVTVTGTTGSGYLTASPDQNAPSSASSLNWTAGKTIANLVTIKVPGDGRINFFVSSPAQVLATVQGYYTKGSGGQTYTPIAPIRALNTNAPVSNTVISLPIRGTQSSGVVGLTVPANATAVIVNYTVTGTGAGGWLGAGPSPATPTTSNLNWAQSGSTLANLAVTPIGADGNINIKVYGSAQVIADVFGYFSPTGSSTFTPTSPTVLLDTRTDPTSHRFADGETRLIQVGGKNGVPNGVTAVVLNVTALGSTHSGWLRAWASDGPTPSASNLNWAAGATVPNQVVVPVGADGKIKLYTNYGTNVLIGVFGYYTLAG